MKIAIVGYGYVGKAMVAALDLSDNIDYDIVDPAYEEYANSLSDVMQSCDAAIVSVPTPQGSEGQCDDSIVLDVVETIGTEKPILIKSTTDIDTLQFFNDKYPNVCFSPEFLRGRMSVEDFLAETKMIIGGEPAQAEGWANVFSECLPKLEEEVFIDIVEAGYVKYAENSFLAMRVTFFNDLYNLMKKAHPDLDYDSMVYALGVDSRIGHSHNEVPGYDGEFGWGGHCLPKDTAAFVNYAFRKESDLPLIRSVIEINEVHRKK
jgi:UDPglucose 6-dehydrogenase